MHVLVVDGDPRASLDVADLCRRLGHDVEIAPSCEEACARVRAAGAALALVDWSLVVGEPDFCADLRSLDIARTLRIVALVPAPCPSIAARALGAGFDDVVHRAPGLAALHVHLLCADGRLRGERRLVVENRRLSDACDRLAVDYRRVANDLALASRVQRSLLPAPGRFGAIEARGFLSPAMYTAGDVYDYFPLGDGLLGFYSVDVVGHGSAAAMVSFAVRHQLGPGEHSLCRRNVARFPSVDEAVVRTVLDLNRSFYVEDSAQQWFTMIFGIVSIESGHVVLCQAGHPPALHSHRTGGPIEEIGRGGFPVGMFDEAMLDEASFELRHCELAPGDRLMIYSDGVLGGLAPDNDALGKERLKAAFAAEPRVPLGTFVDALEQRLDGADGRSGLEDDVSVVVFERAA